MVTWCCLSTDADNSWHKFGSSFVSWGIKDSEISVDDGEDVHELSLVLMNSLDLDIIHSINWYVVSSFSLDPLSQSPLILIFDFNELILELLISGIRDQVSQVVKSSNPLIDASKSLTDEV